MNVAEAGDEATIPYGDSRLLSRRATWTVVRLTLGVLQMTGAAVALGLLLATGVTTAALILVVLLTALMTISIMLFGAVDHVRHPMAPRCRST